MNIWKISVLTAAVLFCSALSAAGQPPEPATADSLPMQTIGQAAIRRPDAIAQDPAGTKEHTGPRLTADPLPMQTIEEKAIRKLTTMAQDLADTKEHTNPRLTMDSWRTIAGLSLIIAVIGLIVSYFNYDEQKRTQANTSRLTLEEQQGILLDLVRHLYRNLVVTRTIETKMRALDFQAYPSEEHLVKLLIPLERIKLDSFLSINFTALSNLYLLFRNYNEEVMIIKDHFRNPALHREVKERDLETLTFKCGFLAWKIHQFLVGTSAKQKKGAARQNDDFVTEIYEAIKKSHNENVNNNSSYVIAPEIEKAITCYMDEDNRFMKILDSKERKAAFWKGLNRDIRIECGNKQKAEEMAQPGFTYRYTTDKVYMIRFDNDRREKPTDGRKDKTVTTTRQRSKRQNRGKGPTTVEKREPQQNGTADGQKRETATRQPDRRKDE